jgi:hypothetical protein
MGWFGEGVLSVLSSTGFGSLPIDGGKGSFLLIGVGSYI